MLPWTARDDPSTVEYPITNLLITKHLITKKCCNEAIFLISSKRLERTWRSTINKIYNRIKFVTGYPTVPSTGSVNLAKFLFK